MKTNQAGRQLIEHYEGLILGAYDDANDHVVPVGGAVRGTLTIGYGHTTAAGAPKVYIGQKITSQQADDILAADLAKVEKFVTSVVKVPINENQFSALVSFTFNEGNGALKGSSLLRKLNDKDYKGAADAFLLWTKGLGQPSLPGLVTRRHAERALFLKPVFTTITKSTAPVVVGGTVAAGTTAAITHPEHWPWIVGGVFVALLGAWAIYHITADKN